MSTQVLTKADAKPLFENIVRALSAKTGTTTSYRLSTVKDGMMTVVAQSYVGGTFTVNMWVGDMAFEGVQFKGLYAPKSNSSKLTFKVL